MIDLLKGYLQIDDRDEPRAIREKVTGKLLTLDRALEPALPALLALLDVPVEDRRWEALDPPAAAAADPRRAQAAPPAGEPGPAAPGRVRGSPLDRRRDAGACSTAWSRACRRPGSCSSSTTARSTGTAGAGRPTTASSGSTRSPPENATALLETLLGADASARAPQAPPHRADRGQPASSSRRACGASWTTGRSWASAAPIAW